MTESNETIPISAINLEQAITDVIQSLAIEGTALSNILKSESEIIQKTKNISDNIDDFISVNETVNMIVKNIFRLKMLIQFELENTEEMLQKIKACYEIDELEE